MRVLFLTQVLPFPLDAGPKVRAYYTLRHLAARHTVTLASLVRATDRPAALARLREYCADLLTVPIARSPLGEALALGRSLLTGSPFLIARDRVAALHAALAARVARTPFDVIHADQLWMAPYALAARAAAQRAGYRPRLVLDQHNAVHLIPRRMASAAANPLARAWLAAEAARMARYEAATCREFDAVVTVTAADGRALQGLYPPGNRPAAFPVIPICVEPPPGPPPPPAPEPIILFVGGMHWPPNADGVLWFAREALPLVRASVPAARLYAVGLRPPPALAALAPAVTAPGYVDDPEDYWRQARVFVVPLRAGGGMRVKILDAWARGVPVVSTTIGAEGLAYNPGQHILIADTPAALAEAVRRVLSDPALAQRLASGGRAIVAQHYDWRTAYPAWDAVYNSLAGAGPSGGG
jgi:glycosyltransferase involved in cell wall biosynthesis